MLPKLKLDGDGVSAPAVSPLPERGIARLELDAFEVIVSVPLAVPEAVGSNTTVKEAV